MNIIILLGHPNKNSFNHAIAQICRNQLEKNGHTVFFHDLYEEKFNPLHTLNNSESTIDIVVEKHISHLRISDGIIVIHPNWWGQPPAIVKGWLDRVLLPGIAYNFVQNKKMENIPIGFLKAKVALVFNTSNAPNNIENDPLDSIWKNNVFKFCGVNQVERKNYCALKESNFKQRSLWLSEVSSIVNTHFPEIKK